MIGDVHESPGEPRERSIDELRAELADSAGRMRELLAEIDSRTAPPPQPRRLRLIHGAGGLLGLAGIGAALKSRPGAAAILAAGAVAALILLPSSTPLPDAPRPPSIAEPAPERPAPPPLEPRAEAPTTDTEPDGETVEGPADSVADAAPPPGPPPPTTPPADQPPGEPPADRTTPRPQPEPPDEPPAEPEPEPCLRVEAPPPDADINPDVCLDEVLAVPGRA